ncbi:MAG: gamma-glutamyltransferase [Rhodospirillaceae bacterium]
MSGFLGVVVADDPQAAVVGREILSAGGTAADAVTAMYFTMAVTNPTHAGLSGGGVCVVRDNIHKRNDTLEFLAQVPVDAEGRLRGGVPVPGNPRGFATLHAKLGKLPWGNILRPAENLARFGNQVSRAFARDLHDNRDRLARLPAVVHLFRKAGTDYLAGEGERMDRSRLAGVLARLRARGVGDFYAGQIARDFVAEANQLGGRLTVEDMRAYLPEVRPTIVVPYLPGTDLHFPSPPNPGGAMSAHLSALLMEMGLTAEKATVDRAHALAEAAQLSASVRRAWLLPSGRVTAPAYVLTDEDSLQALAKRINKQRHTPRAQLEGGIMDPADGRQATGMVAIDLAGSAVACTVTMNRAFGSGRVLPSLGILLAQAVGRGSPPPNSATPVMIVRRSLKIDKTDQVYMAATATGGPSVIEALADMVFRVSAIGESLEAVIKGPRIVLDRKQDALVAEPGLDTAVADALKAKGHRIETGPSGVIINAIYCETGVPGKTQSCAARADSRGFGLSAEGD